MKTAAQSILILAAFGWLAAGTPWRGDQALYAQYAERMSHGEVLYKDLWDVANPGVFWFYQAGGTLFGFDEDGIHLFEWLWITAFVLAVQRVAKVETLAVPLLVGGWYCCTGAADPSHLTKVEGLAVAPLVLSIMLLNRKSEWAWIAAGVCGGVVLLFKLAFAPILAVAWLPAVWRSRQESKKVIQTFVVVPVTLWIAASQLDVQALEAMFTALFITPREMLAAAEPAPLSRLMLSVRWFVETASPLLVLAAAGLLVRSYSPPWLCREGLGEGVDFLPRKQDSRGWEKEPSPNPSLQSQGGEENHPPPAPPCKAREGSKTINAAAVHGLLLALPAAAVVILIQRWSWWTYHFQLPGLLLATLAALTWPALSATFPQRRWRLLLPLLFLPVLLHGASAGLRLLQHSGCLRPTDRAAARLAAGNAYRVAAEECAGVPFEPGDTLFVAGDPLFYRFTPCRPATRTHGWSLELFTPKLWQQLSDELRAKPPQWIYIDSSEYRYLDLATAKAPELLSWVRENFRVHRESSRGVWFVRN